MDIKIHLVLKLIDYYVGELSHYHPSGFDSNSKPSCNTTPPPSKSQEMHLSFFYCEIVAPAFRSRLFCIFFIIYYLMMILSL